jgi:hypothetical protein
MPLSALGRARAEFFDTRIGGRAEVWAALRLVCEMVEMGRLEEAQAVLDAAGCTCPSGELWGRKGGCYDELGERYVVPDWCLGRPNGVFDDGDGKTAVMEGEGLVGSRDTKGKGKVVEDDDVIRGREINVKARLSHSARDVLIRIGDEDSVNLLLRRVRVAAEVCLFQDLEAFTLLTFTVAPAALSPQNQLWRETSP